MVGDGLCAQIVERMQKDQFLPEDFPEVEAPRASERTVVVLTGATGFLGAALLVELLAQPDVEVRCLVRGKTPEEGLARIHENLRRYSFPVGELSRVTVFAGNLELPRLGLSMRDFQALGEGVTCVLHCAASMLWTRSYEKLGPRTCWDVSKRCGLRRRRVHGLTMCLLWGSISRRASRKR